MSEVLGEPIIRHYYNTSFTLKSQMENATSYDVLHSEEFKYAVASGRIDPLASVEEQERAMQKLTRQTTKEYFYPASPFADAGRDEDGNHVSRKHLHDLYDNGLLHFVRHEGASGSWFETRTRPNGTARMIPFEQMKKRVQSTKAQLRILKASLARQKNPSRMDKLQYKHLLFRLGVQLCALRSHDEDIN